MLEKFFPKVFVKSIYELDHDFFSKNKIDGIILDIDNTLVPYKLKEPTDQVLEWINGLKKRGIKVCILSNASIERVQKFNEKMGLDAIHKAGKPFPQNYRKLAEMMKLSPKNIAVIGDQIFTDILGGNIVGMYSILVDLIEKNESMPIKMKRILEKFVLHEYNKTLIKR